MALTGTTTPRHAFKTFAGADRPDLAAASGGLTEILNQIDARIERELSRVENQAAATITATTAAGADTVVTSAAVTLDGATPIEVQFYTPNVDRSTNDLHILLFAKLGAAAAAPLSVIGTSFPVRTVPGLMVHRFTPAAGTWIFSVRAYVDAGNGTVYGGTGTGGANAPSFIRIVKPAT